MARSDRHARIAQNYNALLTNRTRVESRLTEARRCRTRIGKYFDNLARFAEVDDQRFVALDTIEDFEADIRRYIEHLDREIAKVNEGMEALEGLRGQKGVVAFAEYMLHDTELSLQNITMTCYEYDIVLDAMRQIEKTS